MSDMFQNAANSLRLGVEDYLMNDPPRTLSAIRNFYSGLLLLAKEVLVRAAPRAREHQIIAEHYKPVPDGSGGVKYVAKSQRTIDLATIGDRFKDFSISIDHSALKELGRIRNEIEHHHPKGSNDTVRQAIAKSIPVAGELFRLADEDPRVLLGTTWDTMLEVREVYEAQLNACRATYEKIEWRHSLLEDAGFACPACRSDLVAQDDPSNTDFQSATSHCRSCGESINAEALIENAMDSIMYAECYIAMTDGGDSPLQACPECGLETYVLSEEEVGCVWCEVGCVWCDCVLDECAVCHVALTPDNHRRVQRR